MQLILIFLLCFSLSLYPTSPLLTISEPGNYELGANLSFSASTSSDSIILISSSNVSLDLKNYIISQSNPSTPMLAGITVAPNLTNVKIANGTLSSINGSGVLLQSGDQVATLQNITTLNCTTGISLQNSSFINLKNIMSFFTTTAAISISSFSSYVNLDQILSFSTTGGNAIDISQSNNCMFSNCLLSNCSGQCISITNGSSFIMLDHITSVSGVTGGINISQANNCSLNNSSIINCGTGGTTAFNVFQSEEINSNNCRFLRNANGSNSFTVVNLNGVNMGLFTDLIVSSSSTNTVNAINLNQSSQLIFQDCSVNNSIANGFVGFGLSSNTTFSCLFDNCAVINCSSSSTFTGFSLQGITNTVLKNCEVLDNQATQTVSAYSLSSCSRISLDTCRAINNNAGVLSGITISSSNLIQVLSSIIANSFVSGLVKGVLFNTCNDCSAVDVDCYNLTSSSQTAFGFDLIGSTSCQLTNCRAFNIAGSGTTIGIFVEQSSRNCDLVGCMGCNQTSHNGQAIGIDFTNTISCAAQDCIAIRNDGSNVSNTIGYLQSGVAGNTLIRNTSLGHPTLNFSGFNSNNFIVPAAATDTNSTCSPWTNFGITG